MRSIFKAHLTSPAQTINLPSGPEIIHNTNCTNYNSRYSFPNFPFHYQLIRDKLIKYENDPFYMEINDDEKRGTPTDHKGLLNPNLMCIQNDPVKRMLFHHYEQIKEYQKDFSEIRSGNFRSSPPEVFL